MHCLLLWSDGLPDTTKGYLVFEDGNEAQSNVLAATGTNELAEHRADLPNLLEREFSAQDLSRSQVLAGYGVLESDVPELVAWAKHEATRRTSTLEDDIMA